MNLPSPSARPHPLKDPRYTHTVTRDEYEALLEQLRAEVEDPRQGLFGPHSVLWRISRENAVYFTGGRTMLLQSAHPFVAYALEEQSYATRARSLRFRNTLWFMSRAIYGDLEMQFHAGRELFRRHELVKGHVPETVGPYEKGMPYSALNVGALLWSNIAVWDSSLQAYELLFGPLSREEKAQFNREANRFAMLLGVGPDALPASWDEVQSLIREWLSLGVIRATPAARRQADAILAPASAAWRIPADLYVALTARFLEPQLAAELGIDKASLKNRALAEGLVRWLRTTYRLLPSAVRHMPAYREAMDRLDGELSPSPVNRWFNQLWVGKPSFFGPVETKDASR